MGYGGRGRRHKGHARTYREINGIDSLKSPARSLVNHIEALWNDVEAELGQMCMGEGE